MTNKLPKLAIILPCFNEEMIVEKSAEKLMIIFNNLINKQKINPDSFIYFVDDGSTDKTWQLIENLHNKNKKVRGLKFSRNFGHQSAILAGLLSNKDRADCFITIDADLQDDISVIEDFIDNYNKGYEIIYGVKKNTRKDSFMRRYTTILFFALMKIMRANIVHNHADFRFASRKAVKTLSNFGEVNLFLRGVFPTLGFKSKTISYYLGDREAGVSHYGFRKRARLAWDGITSISTTPLRMITLSGIIIIMISLFLLIWIIIKAFNGNIVVSWILLLSILFIGGLQIMSIGLVGEYIGKIYKETKARPRYIKEREIF